MSYFSQLIKTCENNKVIFIITDLTLFTILHFNLMYEPIFITLQFYTQKEYN